MRIAGNDETAFTQLYFHFGKKLNPFRISLVRSKEIAEELVEDVFVKLWANRIILQKLKILLFIYM